jgi:anti-sigma factor RsiW
MNQHVTDWLGAYHDGELEESRRQQVEAHLQVCEDCHAELNRLRALARLLQASPLPGGLMPPERFVSQVRLQLPPRPAQPAWRLVLEIGWRLAPLGLLGVWGFVQAIFIVSAAVLVALWAGLDINLAGQWLPSAPDMWAAQILTLPIPGLEVGTILEFLGDDWLPVWSFALETGLLIVTGLLYWSWLASWWVRQQHRQA